MSLTVNFKTQSGAVTNRRFQPGVGVSVYGTFKSVLFPDFNAFIRLDVLDASGNSFYFKEDSTNLYGDYALWFRTPDFDTKATVKLTGKHAGGGVETVIIPIAIGNETPDKLPDLPKEASIFDNISTLLILLIILMAGFIYIKN